MPSPGTLTRYDIVGVKEDISEIISNISPTDTPFQTSIGKETCDNTIFQWQEDSLLAVQNLAALEGADAPAASFQPTLLRNNTTQILTLTAKASGTSDRVKKYGRAKELAYQLGMRSKELKRDLENTFVGVGVGQVSIPGSNTIARQMAGAQAMMLDVTVNTVGTPTALTEAMVVSTGQNIYNAGAEASVLMVKPNDALKIAGFKNNNRTTFVENEDKKLVNVVDVYVCPYGSYKVVKNRFIKATDALLVDPMMWKRVVLRDWFRKTLAETGDSTNVQILGEFSLKHKNFNACALITNLS